MTTTELQRELADASNVIAALTAKLERADNANVRARAMICDAAGIPHDADILEWISGARERIEALQADVHKTNDITLDVMRDLDRANETIKGLEATIGSLHHERDRERRAHAKAWDAMSARIARLEEAGDALKDEAWPTMFDNDESRKRRLDAIDGWTAAKEDKS